MTVTEKINKRNLEELGPIQECCSMYENFCTCKSKKINKMESIEYLVENRIDCDIHTTEGMLEILILIITNKDNYFHKRYLDSLLEKASNY
jgi:hypothetical protein